MSTIPPLTVGIAAAIIAAVRRIPFVYAIHDMWPDTLAASGMVSNRVSTWNCRRRLCRWVYARADRIVVVSPGFKRALGRKRSSQVQDRGDLQLGQRTGSAVRRATPILRLLRSTGVSTLSLPETWVRLKDWRRCCRQRKLSRCCAAGSVHSCRRTASRWTRLRACATEMELRSVRIMPRMPQSEIGNLLAAADVLLVHLKDEPLCSASQFRQRRSSISPWASRFSWVSRAILPTWSKDPELAWW